jgi:hypothetical protein
MGRFIGFYVRKLIYKKNQVNKWIFVFFSDIKTVTKFNNKITRIIKWVRITKTFISQSASIH